MKRKSTLQFKVVFVILFCLILNFKNTNATRRMEYLNRGGVAIKITDGVFLSWRLLGTESTDLGFNIYRDGEKINSTPLSGATNYTDSFGTINSKYVIKSVENDVEIGTSNEISVWATFYSTIQLDRPDGGTTPPNQYGSVGKSPKGTYPDGQDYTYTPNDCSVADLDGDGEYELIVKWDPSNSQDNSYYGITGEVYIDAYKLNGTKLWRINLGKNIRAGAHYTQFMVYDFDSDGKAEMVCKTAPGTIDGLGNYVIMNDDDPEADYRNLDITQTSGSNMLGIVIKGPEYLTLFDGETGAELNSVTYEQERGSVSSWGDSYGNRSERYLACVAYLDGENPSVVMGRGYYKRATIAAYDVVEKKLQKRWLYDSNDYSSSSSAYGQGNHNLSVGDVDGDGRDEIMYGSCAFDDDGTLLYRTGLGHGDAMHMSDLDPSRPGLEVYCVHEDKSSAYGFEMHDAATGEVLWGEYTGTDVGRGMSGDIDPNYEGFESWCGNNIYSCTGELITSNKPGSINFRIYWDGDLQDELLDYTKIQKWNPSSETTSQIIDFASYTGASSINTTKANPCLSADIIGDWREEVFYYNKNNPGQIYLFTTTTPTDYRLYTLMHDPTYRMAVAWQNTSYNQPPHLGFYIGDGVENVPIPDITFNQITSSVYNKVDLKVKITCKYYDNFQIFSENTIESIEIYNLKGVLLYSNTDLYTDNTSFKYKGSDRLLIVKVETVAGVEIQKIIR